MVLTESDRYLIRALREEKKMSLNQILREFPGRQWKKSTVADFLKRLKATGSIERRPGSGRRRKVNCPEKVKIVQKLICSKDDATGKNLSVRKIALLTGVSRSMVSKIASNDLGIKPVKKKVSVQARMKQRAIKEKRLELCKNLLQRFSNKELVKKIWFSGEKRFTVEKPDHVKVVDADENKSDHQKKSNRSKKGKNDAKETKAASSQNEAEDEEEDTESSNESEMLGDAKNLNSNTENVPQCDNDITGSNINMTNVNIPSGTTQVLNPSTVNVSNADVPSPGNDVVNLINNYVLNPIHYRANQSGSNSGSYGSEQSHGGYQPNCHLSGYTVDPSGYEGGYALSADYPPHGMGNYVQLSANCSSGSGNVQGATKLSEEPAAPNVRAGTNSVVVSIAVSVNGRSQPIFVEGASGNISSECYRKNVLFKLLPYIKSKTGDFVFIHDRSPAHRSQNTVRFLRENCPDFVKPEEWPANCPQLNPVDYYVWKKLQSMVYRGEAIKSIQELKDRILSSWQEISQKNINSSILQWLSKLRNIVNKAKD